MIFKFFSTFQRLWFYNFPSSLPIQAFQNLSGSRMGGGGSEKGGKREAGAGQGALVARI